MTSLSRLTRSQSPNPPSPNPSQNPSPRGSPHVRELNPASLAQMHRADFPGVRQTEKRCDFPVRRLGVGGKHQCSSRSIVCGPTSVVWAVPAGIAGGPIWPAPEKQSALRVDPAGKQGGRRPRKRMEEQAVVRVVLAYRALPKEGE